MNHDSTLSFFDLKHSPFGKEVNVKDLWLDPSRESAVGWRRWVGRCRTCCRQTFGQ